MPKRIENWSLTSLQQRLVKTGGWLVKHPSGFRNTCSGDMYATVPNALPGLVNGSVSTANVPIVVGVKMANYLSWMKSACYITTTGNPVA